MLFDWRAFLWGAGVMLAYVPGIPPAAVVGRWAAIIIGLGLFMPRWREVDGTVRWLLAAGVAWAALGLWWMPDILTGTLDLLMLLVLIAVFFTAATWLWLDDVMLGMAAGLLVSGVLVAMQVNGWHGLPEISSPSGLFYNKDLLAECAAPILVWLIVSRRFALAIPIGLTIAFCTSRTALIAIMFGLLFCWWRMKWWKSIVCTLVLLISGMHMILGGIPEKAMSAGDRINTWVHGAILLTPKGYGIGFYHAAVPQGQLIHSDVLQMGGELGVGVLLFLLIPVVMFWKAMRDDDCWTAEWAAFATVCLEALISFPLHQVAASFVAAVLAGWLSRRRLLIPMVRRDSGADCGISLYERAARDACAG